jgi:hypothetical protein
MRVLLAVFTGSAVAAAFALLAQWILSGGSGAPTVYSAALGAPGIPALVTGAAVVAGSFVAVRIHDSFETLTAFATIQLFFGPALIRQLWLGRGPVYAAIALAIIFSLTAAGARMGSQRRLRTMLEAE